MNNLNVILEDFEKIAKACDDLDGKTVHIGIIGGGDAAKIAHIHEYGDGHMPERSFIRASFDQDQSKLADIVEKSIDNVVTKGSSADAAMNAVGAQGAQMVQNFIDENRVTPPSDFSENAAHDAV